ncbi:ATP-grasp domain-containing protein [Flavivirga aquimarina]|uniref:ATP-grasp domain-containing protein n=1 Tax=Flavivirga aquimarina TaxID=2027862 RepID=A0ABT8WDP7_9FLAO|nr:ATP-grasp domain-containing protein [Flavivirga aquimarina]MDO5971182.1 ATP-grasp domain-containing protein [Flavivirga aquimarina]
MKKQKKAILIPDGESHILLYVINCLAQVKNLKIYVMSNKKHNPMRYSRHIKGFSYYEQTSSDLDWIYNINKEVEKHDIDVIMPIFETGIRILIEHKTKVLHQDRLGLLPSLADFDTAINKGFLSEHLEENRIPGPKSVIVASNTELDRVDALSFPVIIKPMEGFGGGQGISIFNSKEDLKKHFTSHNFNYINIIQEYIEGYDIDCSVLCKNGEILASTIQKGNMIGKSQFTPQFGLLFLYEEALYQVVERLMKSLNWSGVAHIDMRYNQNTKQFNIIEVNTRFWVSLDASLIAGVNFPHLYSLSSIGSVFPKPEYKFVEYLNLKGLVRKIKQNITFLFKVKFILNNTPLKFALLDPLPMVYKYITRTRNILISRFR